MRTPMTRPGRKPSRQAGPSCGTPAPVDADHVVTALYLTHYRSLVRLAALLVPDLGTAEEIVQDSFAAVYRAWPTLPDADDALCYLRRSVVHRSRSVPRPRVGAGRRAPHRPPDLPGADPEAGHQVERSAVVSALQALPARQREVLVLRYFAGLPETQIASATGISEGAVKSHTARAMSSLRAELLTTKY